jgi:hypothetical protein
MTNSEFQRRLNRGLSRLHMLGLLSILPRSNLFLRPLSLRVTGVEDVISTTHINRGWYMDHYQESMWNNIELVSRLQGHRCVLQIY